jgi:small-conductance mechanosensitive channel
MLARLAFGLLGLVVALEILNATALLGAVLCAAGLAGLAIGYAVRDTVENFIASLMLSLRQPFRPDDLVEIEGDVGRVARLTSRATILISAEGNHIRIPNATVFKGRIVNYTREPLRWFEFELGVDAEADHSRALATGVEAIAALAFVEDDLPVSAWIRDVGDSNVVLSFTGWVDQTRTDFLKARGAAVQAAKVALENNGFGLPKPIYRLRLDAAPGLKLDLPRNGSLSANEAPTKLGPRPGAGELPASADPRYSEDVSREVAARERAEAGEERNLLDHGRQME